jgi:ABC-type bacteriocin/lantibiotic exporter with double-glycine peptidase domain
MEKNIIRILAWVQFLLLFALVMNHMSRGLTWLPLCILFIPSIGMIWSIEREVE